jgi:hypothetical protein
MDLNIHKVCYIVKDAFGNNSQLIFWVKSQQKAPSIVPEIKNPKGTLLACGKNNHFSSEDITFDLPPDALYEDLDFIYSRSTPVHGSYSPVYHLQNETVPLHSACALSINANNVPKALLSNAIIVKVSESGYFTGKSSKRENDVIKTQIREFGNYTIAVDTVPPAIKPINVAPNKNVGKQQTLSFKISDNLSGIQSYRGTLNGKWILMKFDAKSNLLVYTFDDHIHQGKNSFRLVVKDAVGNESVYQASLTR